MALLLRGVVRALVPLLMFLSCVLAEAGCTCTPELPPVRPHSTIACRTRDPSDPPRAGRAPGVKTVAAGAMAGTFSITSTGEATYVMPLVSVPGRAGVEPRLALQFDSAAGEGALGAGFSIAGLSAITRCPKSLAQDGEIRGVRYDEEDALCLDNKRLVAVKRAPGTIEYRTFPDTRVKVVGHYAAEGDAPAEALFFEAMMPSGLVIEYGSGDSGKPLALGGAPRAWLATRARDGRGNAMTYDYCLANAEEGFTAEYALDEIRYTSFEGEPEIEPSRAVRFVYATKEPAEVRAHYAGGMDLQSALRLDEIQMLGPDNTLVRRYGFTYEVSETTRRTLLTEVEECAGDGVCKPPTRFQYSRGEVGFQQIATDVARPTSKKASPMLLDIDGDGLDDLVLPDTVAGLSTPRNPITGWLVARNRGPGAAVPYPEPATLALFEDWPVVDPSFEAADPAFLQPELGTSIDYNQDGRTDILLHDVHDATDTWHVLLARPDRTFEVHDTGIRRPFPLGVRPTPPGLSLPEGAMHLADVDGDGVPDLIQCDDHSRELTLNPFEATWLVHRWKPERDGTPAGFDRAGESLEPLNGFPCEMEIQTLDLNADSQVDLVVATVLTFSDGAMLPASTWAALTRRHDGSWEVFDTKLPQIGGRVVFLDVNGDGLPDAVQSGFSYHGLRTYLNTGATFATPGVESLGQVGFIVSLDPEDLGDSLALDPAELGAQDTFFQLATPLDYNNDGMQDLLMPVPPGMLPGSSLALPSWAILQATGARDGPTFALVDPKIPFEAAVGEAVTLAEPHGPRVGDINGDGAQDVVLPIDGVFTIFQSRAADQDLLVAVSDGMNAHEPTEAGFVPNVSVAYGHLTDASVTNDTAAGDPEREGMLYLSRDDAANDCAYPRRCAVGPRRVVSGYAVNNGADRPRRFEVRYRDGRYHRLGRGFLGFGERVVIDLDTRAGTAERYDNVTFDEELEVFPFAGQVKQQRRWAPGLPGQPRPDRIELSFLDVERTLVPTSEGASYFTLPTERRIRQAQGVYPPESGAAPTVEAYVELVDRGGGGATLLRDSVARVTEFDAFGNVITEEVSTRDVDLTLDITRTYKNDTERWVLGQLATEQACSAAAGRSQCRLLTRTTTDYGEIDTESTDSDEGIPDTKLDVVYTRDDFGNVTGVTVDDAFGHHRAWSTTYDPEGIFPETHVNAAGHTTRVELDEGLGVLVERVDPNGLVTEWRYDGFGRLGLEIRPDGTQTTIELSRTKDGGSDQDGWRVTQRTTTPGGVDDTVEYDSLGRPIRWLWHGPSVEGTRDELPRLMQEIAYDARGEHIARRSVPAREGTPEDELLVDAYEHDAAGREVRHTTPWNAVVETDYDALRVEVTDALGHVTAVEKDPLGRPVAVTDAALGVTRYGYGPFGALHAVTDPGGAVTTTTHDAFGRVRKREDPDRGTTVSTNDGFGELVTSTDALGRVMTLSYDALGRTTSRLDEDGTEQRTTTWTWDTAAHGIGKLEALESPDGAKTYTYNEESKLETVTLRIDGEGAPLESRLDYDDLGRIATITYPTPAGAAPFVVAHDRDAHGHVLAVRDAATRSPYWRLTDVDDAGRFREEAFGNGTVTERSYFADKQRLESLVTRRGTGEVQDLSYDYDARLSLTLRTDALQPQHRTERFRHDALDRLTCAYFSETESASVPCALRYEVAPDGNLTFKSDVGTLSYDDPLHPHAVTGAGTDRFSYDAVGNQIARPGGVTVRYTPFDLPATITQGASTVSFAYDGDQQRIRKTTPDEETLYFGDLYERVTDAATGSAEHRYHVHSPERLVAIVTRGGTGEGTRYVHVDHLGSVDALTGEDGAVVERRSYDPFGRRRDPVWGEPVPASFSSETTRGFTGHEGDDELGLVNMKGRMFDPRIGRFLTTDPIVQAPLSGQSWNPYSYVRNSPLNYVDPSGFQGEPEPPPLLPIYSKEHKRENLVDIRYQPREGKQRQEKPIEAAEVGATTAPVDVGTTGTSSGYVPQPVTVSPEHAGAGGPGTIVGQTLLGAAEGTGDLGFGIARSLVLNALTFGIYGGYELGGALWQGYEQDGILGALNAVNPLFHIGQGAADTALAIDRGDYRAAGAAGTRSVILAAATVFGMGRGLGAAAEESAVAGAARGAALRPYGGPGGGHHVPAKNAFAGAPGYDANAALAIPNAELTRLGVSHSAVTGAQMTGYRAFARTGAPLTWETVRTIETNALVRGGMAPDVAQSAVNTAVKALQEAGVARPTRVPWGG
ncbi:RHS repeat-associated core domain-containing protein [Sorangium sp. So ce887]|uniref:RHS repeat-associated core domain-containing protein n=1 Tax=Sorangium sp. So ce887 TaxID=3133324 RepID=UPI003F61C5B4